MAVLVCVAFACSAALPPASGAATVIYYPPEDAGARIQVHDFIGETNRLTLDGKLAPTLSQIRDDSARLTALPGVDTATLHCVVLGYRAACWSELTNFDRSFWFEASLEAGNDSVTVVGNGPSRLFGGAGDDHLSGGSGRDWLIGGAGADQLHGGGGFDLAIYSADPEGVNVSLDDLANDGAPGEGENVHSDIEEIDGTLYADILIGNDQVNSLHGYWGDDTVEAGGGDDDVGGSAGQDSISAGPGDDRVDVEWGPADPDVVDCGPGTDAVIADPEDQLLNCENVTLD